MSQLTRRTFLQGSLAAAASITIGGTKSSGKVLGANDTIRVAVAGINGRGKSHIDGFAGMKGVQVVALIDPDTRLFASRSKSVEAKGKNTPKTYQDIRKALDDKDIDVVTIATPNHWHALMTIWACQAGRDVYVEKPCSHNIHEGRIAVEMARKYNRIVQHGTQSRSGNEGSRIQAYAKSGKLGKLLISRGLCYKDGGTGGNTRGNIGFKPMTSPPSGLDFDIWLGPAPTQPFHENLVHYRWHWFWDFGNGDIGNQGVHEIDKARWAIPGATLPRSVISLGGRLGHQDQGQTASSQVAVFDYGETQLIFEVRGLPSQPYMGEKVGNTYHFEAGTIAGSKFYPKGKDKAESLPEVSGDLKRGPGGRDHFGNFIAAVRSRKVEDLNADILEGHYSAALCHLANMSLRLGEQVPFNPRTKALGDNKDAYDALSRMEGYLRERELKLEEMKYLLGRKLTIDAKSETILGDAEANKLLTRDYRKPFAVPDKV